ncbi:hypothetical protein LLH06_10725 [Mucilaginibacter daejeonensis]|uniref:hypothetical protein n=1 Tax=Mucilaginibacter daejeonensis TaxID=398049 RepID=UPI001D17C197|nr:hypothetical protein [Mucilaginibacter daejeonensis]UEG51447.1 hypothetical protein LLH06_10725 [Mucilaginibacter daejeonensis]
MKSWTLVAYLSLHSSFYPDLNAVSLIALGNVPLPKQIRYLCARYKNRRFELIFGNDLLAPLIDIKIALALKQQWVTFTLVKDQVAISCNQGTRQFSLDRLSLSAFQKAFGLRTSVRTRKSKRHTYFLNELLESHSIDGLSGDR